MDTNLVFDLAGKNLKPLWQSSNLEAPNCECAVADVDRDGANDLIVIEGSMRTGPTAKAGILAYGSETNGDFPMNGGARR